MFWLNREFISNFVRQTISKFSPNGVIMHRSCHAVTSISNVTK